MVLKIAVVSNEARETERVSHSKFQAGQTCGLLHYILLRPHPPKPDPDIFRLALDITQASAEQVLFIDNTPMFRRDRGRPGIRSILHADYQSTCAKLSSFGLLHAEGEGHGAF